MKKLAIILCLVFLGISLSCAQSENPPKIQLGNDSTVFLQKIVDGIDIPWGIAFINNEEFLVTDRKGVLYHVINGEKNLIKGLPKIVVKNQGGLLDVKVDKDFEINKNIYFTASISSSGNNNDNTALFKAKYENYSLSNLQLLYKADPDTEQTRHYGGSILLDKNHIYFAVGDRAGRDIYPQDLTKDGGKLYRLYLDGSIPDDNPFVDIDGAISAIWSYGHRNPQGIISGGPGIIIMHEHGPRGGDEINIIQERDSIRKEPLLSRNYGWPIVSFGINYNGTKFTNITSSDETEPPLYFWTPSIAPSGMIMLKSNKYPNWNGNLFIGSLKFRYLERIELIGTNVIKREKLFDRVGRVRQVVESPDGYIYIGVENKGIFKLIPSIVNIPKEMPE